MKEANRARRRDTPEFCEPETQLLDGATELLRRGGPESVSLASVSQETQIGIGEVARVFPTNARLRERHGEYLAVWVVRHLLEATDDDHPRSVGLAMVGLWEREPDILQSVLTGPVFSAGESLVLDLVRVLLPDVVVPDEPAARERWLAGLRSLCHTSLLVAGSSPDPERRSELLTAAMEGAGQLSELLASSPPLVPGDPPADNGAGAGTAKLIRLTPSGQSPAVMGSGSGPSCTC